MILRRLVPLSKIEFGQHAGKKVESIMVTPSGKQYMRWLYFHASHIDLTQDLLNELEIKYVLVKPGKDPELYEKEYAKMTKNKGFKTSLNGYSLLSMIPKSDWNKNRTPAAQAARNRKQH